MGDRGRGIEDREEALSSGLDCQISVVWHWAGGERARVRRAVLLPLFNCNGGVKWRTGRSLPYPTVCYQSIVAERIGDDARIENWS